MSGHISLGHFHYKNYRYISYYTHKNHTNILKDEFYLRKF